MSLLNDDVKLLNMTTNVACIAGGFVVCFPFVVMVRKVRRSCVKDKQRSNEKTMGEGSSGKRQRECLPSPSLKVCTDGQLTYSDIITKFPWIDRCSFPIGMFIYHSIECFHSRGQHICKSIGTKESVCIRKEFNSHRTGLGHQHGRRDVM